MGKPWPLGTKIVSALPKIALIFFVSPPAGVIFLFIDAACGECLGPKL
ncbi:MAG: hypothetical protein ACUVWV_04655 [Thermodesulfobacteriota bacterium]